MSEKEIPVLPARQQEVDAYNDLNAALSSILYAKEPIRRRVQLIPNGWRDLCMIAKRLEKLSGDLICTFEQQKRLQIYKTAKYARLKYIVAPEAARDPETHLILSEDLGMIIHAAMEHCKICMGTDAQCKKCQLGRALDRTSYVSREGKGWWEIAAEREMEEQHDGEA